MWRAARDHKQYIRLYEHFDRKKRIRSNWLDMTCKHYIENQCHLIIEWQPDRYITENFCIIKCNGNFEKLIEWAKAKQNGKATPEELYRRECQRICNECMPKQYCQFKDRLKCKRGLPQYQDLCRENKWPEFPTTG